VERTRSAERAKPRVARGIRVNGKEGTRNEFVPRALFRKSLGDAAGGHAPRNSARSIAVTLIARDAVKKIVGSRSTELSKAMYAIYADLRPGDPRNWSESENSWRIELSSVRSFRTRTFLSFE